MLQKITKKNNEDNFLFRKAVILLSLFLSLLFIFRYIIREKSAAQSMKL